MRNSGFVRVHPHDHVVNFYDEDAHLISEVVRFIASGVRAGEGAVIVATPAHRDAIVAGLRREGITDGYVSRSAAATLSTFVVGDVPDRHRFMSVLGAILDESRRGRRGVRVFGEMVALLWDAGNVAGAIELEGWWNELARSQDFSLFCAYPIASLTAGELEAANRVCERHSDVLPPSSYGSTIDKRPSIVGTSTQTELFVPVPLAIRAVRRFVRDTLDAWGEPALVTDAVLVSSELASNAVRHARSAFRVAIHRRDEAVRIAVHDVSPDPPERRVPAHDTPGGRGINLVEMLSTSWGIEHVAGGKVVWSEFATTRRSS